ncbi:MAG: M23 family metallopeptidase [Anaerolineales bacterium]|nr:MAG: M23 family metallopeptidase [Anaerolineales bacterium]
MSPARLFPLAALAALALVGCAPAPPQPSASPAATDTNTPLPTHTQFVAPSDTPPPTATLPSLEWPTYAAPTLAPFPLAGAAVQPTQPALSGFPAVQAPVALSVFDHFYFTFPVANAHIGLYSPSQRYGARQEAGTNRREPHLGLDVGLDPGTPVRAAGDGTIVWASYGQTYNSPYFLDDPYGISIVIRHNFGYNGDRIWTVYAHLTSVSVEVGQQVKQGELIGLSGNTGLSTGPHLHFEVRTGTNTTNFTYNPELWLAPPEGHGVLVGRVANERDQLLLNWLTEVRSLDTGELFTNYTYFTSFRLQSDPYYKENLVLTNLPAGRYEVAIPLYSIWWRAEIEIKPGAVTYFHFMGRDGYSFELPAEPPLVGVPD